MNVARKSKNGEMGRHPDPIVRRLRQLRGWKGLKKRHFAHQADIPENYWGMIESGERDLSLGVARKLRAAYGVPLDWQFDGEISDKVPEGLLRYITIT